MTSGDLTFDLTLKIIEYIADLIDLIKDLIEYIAKKNIPTNERLQAKWIGDIGVFKEGTMQKIGKASMSTALMYLHFRILNRIYGTNKYLCNIGKRENSI